MHPSFEDITARIAEAPAFWQEGGLPRYGAFDPGMLSVYWREAVLMEIACQGCDARFQVAFHADGLGETLESQIRTGSLHYGDPPNTGCCASGATMNSVPVRIIQYWRRYDERHVDGGRITDWAAYDTPSREPLLEGEYRGWAKGT